MGVSSEGVISLFPPITYYGQFVVFFFFLTFSDPSEVGLQVLAYPCDLNMHHIHPFFEVLDTLILSRSPNIYILNLSLHSVTNSKLVSVMSSSKVCRYMGALFLSIFPDSHK